MLPKIEWSGPMSFRLSNLLTLLHATLTVAARRRLRGSCQPGWSQELETMVTFLRNQTLAAFRLADIHRGREYTDALLFRPPELGQCQIEAASGPVQGSWYTCADTLSNRTLLYLHGGGYVYYAQGIQQMIALAALSTRARTFALDYRLAPEHPYPAAVDDALAAYQWLLSQGIRPADLVVAGDSAGGHLTVSLLQRLRDRQLPLPAMGMLFCPWIDVQNRGDSMQRNAGLDWIGKPVLDQWGQWFFQGSDPDDGRISPTRGSLAGLPPLYVQCGTAEVLYDMICAFVEQARAQRTDVRLDIYEGMVHDFQVFGDASAKSQKAWERVRQVVDGCLGETALP